VPIVLELDAADSSRGAHAFADYQLRQASTYIDIEFPERGVRFTTPEATIGTVGDMEQLKSGREGTLRVRVPWDIGSVFGTRNERLTLSAIVSADAPALPHDNALVARIFVDVGFLRFSSDIPDGFTYAATFRDDITIRIISDE
jgi:hypothetical protein